MSLSTSYTLDKAYFYECFDESLPYSKQVNPKYGLLALLICLGLVAFYILQRHYLGTFMFMLALVECIAFYYKRPWWVTRQMLSRAAGSEVTITFDESGIHAQNPYKSYQLTWQDINQVINTPRGFLLSSKKGMQYVSKHVLDDEIITFLNKRATQ
ncbi:YcxB family protein [Pseudoalteromonas mariniglutinosa]|uniref:YcxB family protein n=1 Tax=Pseudoalteromonas mariniglutinosa TaxID=206042 RepID=UPI0038515FA5